MHMRMTNALGVFFLSFMLCVGLVAIPSCGSSSKRTDTMNAAVISVDSTVIALDAWDAAQRASIVDKATSRDEALAKLAEHDKRIAPVKELVTAALNAAKLALDNPGDTTVAQAVKAATDLVAAFAHLRGGS